MATRDELLDAFEGDLNGTILRCDAFRHPITGDLVHRNENKHRHMPDLRSSIMEIEESPDEANRLERHITYFWDADQDVKANVQFYVMNRGQADEEAFWFKNQNPKPPAPEPSFQQKVLTWLRARVGATVQGFTVRHIYPNVTADEAAQTATAQALGEDGTGYAQIDAFLSRDAEGNIQIEILEITRLGA